MKRIIFNIIAIVLFVGFLSCTFETISRLEGLKPWRAFKFDRNEPNTHQSDSILGWKKLKGEYFFPPKGGTKLNPFTITYLDEYRRKTSFQECDSLPRIVFIGGSATLGWAIDDTSTFAWKLQERMPNYSIDNLGGAAYGTYQSYLLLKEYLKNTSEVKTVICGFDDSHELRNVATQDWLNNLSCFSRRGHIKTPYCTFEAENIVEHPPISVNIWELSKKSAFVYLLQNSLMKAVNKKKVKQCKIVTEHIFLKLKAHCEVKGISFFVAYLTSENNQNKKYYLDFFKDEGINFIDCVNPNTHEMKVPFDGHPNGELNTIWAESIYSFFEQQYIHIDKIK